MRWSHAVVYALTLGVLWTRQGSAQTTHYRLESTDNLRLHNVLAEPAMRDGRKGVRITQDSRADAGGQAQPELLAIVTDLTFTNGSIELEVAGEPATSAFQGARGFVGVAFRLQEDLKTYDALYLRPTNARSEDQERRNHSAQYVSHPNWTWSRLRREAPARYESYVDLTPGSWARIRIEVRGAQARLYVHDQPQPTLIVNDLKSGSAAHGAVALWIGPGPIAHFRNLTIKPSR